MLCKNKKEMKADQQDLFLIFFLIHEIQYMKNYYDLFFKIKFRFKVICPKENNIDE